MVWGMVGKVESMDGYGVGYRGYGVGYTGSGV